MNKPILWRWIRSPDAPGGRFREVGQDVIDSLAFYQQLFDAKLPDEPIYVSSINAGHGQAFDGFMTAAHRTVSTMEGQAEVARKGAKDISEKAIDFAEQNIANSFEFAQKLLRARDVKEMLELQGTYVKTQMQVLAEQARELGETTGKMATEPLKSSPKA